VRLGWPMLPLASPRAYLITIRADLLVAHPGPRDRVQYEACRAFAAPASRPLILAVRDLFLAGERSVVAPRNPCVRPIIREGCRRPTKTWLLRAKIRAISPQGVFLNGRQLILSSVDALADVTTVSIQDQAAKDGCGLADEAGSHLTILAELERAIAHCTAQRRAEMLRQITDLFVPLSARLSEKQTLYFDDLITRLASEAELPAKSWLANRLAPLANAPNGIVRLLAGDDQIEVAEPILGQSEQLDDGTLTQYAAAKGPAHLLAIARRKFLNEAVTDALVKRADKMVMLILANNPGAKLSQSGFSCLIRNSASDDVLTTSIGARRDLPHHLFLDLLGTASKMVRNGLLAERYRVPREIFPVEPYFLFFGDGQPLLAVA
jgi:Uncharacterised protein conserved in bacteria (DUF2336)